MPKQRSGYVGLIYGKPVTTRAEQERLSAMFEAIVNAITQAEELVTLSKLPNTTVH